MTETIHHTTIPVPIYLYGPEGNTVSQVDPTTAPHECNMPGCPGPENKRKLEAFDGLLAALHGLLATEDTDGGDDCQWCSESVAEYSECTNPQCPGVRANAAITKATSPQAR